MSTNLTLTWTQIDVSQRNGIIIRYMIQYGVGTNRNITITTPSSATTHLITGLKPLTEYTFTVAGVNSANTGPFSGPSEVIRTVAANSMFYKGLQMFSCFCFTFLILYSEMPNSTLLYISISNP